jgi:hypothetical protein
MIKKIICFLFEHKITSHVDDYKSKIWCERCGEIFH